MPLYAFLNIRNLLVAWEVAIGRLFSAGTTDDGVGVSLWMFHRLRRLASTPQDHIVRNEFILETVRQQDFPQKTSRLKGLYFFDNEKDALRANLEWNFNFPIRYLCEIEFDCSHFTKVDSQWITHFLDKQCPHDWMKKYWAGVPYNDTPLYEIIAEGYGVIKNKQIKNEAYDKYYREQPDTSLLLATSCCAFSRGFNDISRVVPHIILDGNSIKGTYLISMDTLNNHEHEVSLAVQECIKNNELQKIKHAKEKHVLFRVPNIQKDRFTLGIKEYEMADIRPHFYTNH
jgi:hypothetical protein